MQKRSAKWAKTKTLEAKDALIDALPAQLLFIELKVDEREAFLSMLWSYQLPSLGSKTVEGFIHQPFYLHSADLHFPPSSPTSRVRFGSLLSTKVVYLLIYKEMYDIKVNSSDGMLAISALDVLVVQYQSAFKVKCAFAFVHSFIQSLESVIEFPVKEADSQPYYSI